MYDHLWYNLHRFALESALIHQFLFWISIYIYLWVYFCTFFEYFSRFQWIKKLESVRFQPRCLKWEPNSFHTNANQTVWFLNMPQYNIIVSHLNIWTYSNELIIVFMNIYSELFLFRALKQTGLMTTPWYHGFGSTFSLSSSAEVLRFFRALSNSFGIP